MLKLDRPEYAADETFAACISKVRNPDLKLRLTAVTQHIVDESTAFDNAAQNGVLHQFPRTILPNVSTEEMEKVYTSRMAKEKAPGRAIYDDIFEAAPHGKCPLCQQRPVSTLDHHLPKAFYPALAVAPLNLVPACSDCNKAKSGNFPHSEEEVGLHPYYDDIDGERWLVAQVVETAPAAVRFRVKAPQAWTDLLSARVRNHFVNLGLGSLYASEAADELLNIRQLLGVALATGGPEEVRRELEVRGASAAAGRLNGWRSAAYVAWAASDWFCQEGFAAP